MTSLEELLAPISDVSPAGEDLSFSADFDAVVEARRADDPTLEQGEWITDLKSADWPGVAHRCAKLLRERSKDLRLASWLAEAQMQTQSFAGLADGLRVMTGLLERYWDEVHPQVEDGDLEQRVGNVAWLLTNAELWVRRLPLVQSAQGRYGLVDFEAARNRRSESDPGTGLSMERFDAARRDTPHAFYVRLAATVPECQEALAALEQVVDARLGQESPSFASLREQMQLVREAAMRFAREAGVLLDGDAGDSSGATYAETTIVPTQRVADTPSLPNDMNAAINNRREAIAQLRRVAEFFRQTEPHSPVAYLAEKAARWGEMPLHVWLKRVVKDHSTLEHMLETLDAEAGSSED